MPHEDTITLAANGVAAKTLHLVGPVVPELVEVEVPTVADVAEENDRRAGPSVKEQTDFSGGIGQFYLDQGNGHWNARNVWSMEPGRVTPRPKQLTQFQQGSSDWSFQGLRASKPFIQTTDPNTGVDYIFLVAGNQVFKIDAAGTPTQELGVVQANVGRSIVEFAEKGNPTNHRLFAFFHRLASPRADFYRSAEGDFLDWSTGDAGAGGRELHDGIEFDNKLVAADANGKLVYSATGIDNEWNDELAIDGDPLLDMGYFPITFAGVAAFPGVGFPAIYFLWNGQLRVLNFNTRESFPVPLQNTVPILTATIWQGLVCATDGFNVYTYDPQAQKSTAIGFPGLKTGLPFSRQRGVRYLFPVGEYLGAILTQFGTSTEPYEVHLYNGKGWHSVYSDYDISPSIAQGFAGFASAFSHVGWSALAPQLVVLGAETLDGTANSMHIHIYRMPEYGNSPVNEAQDDCYISPDHVFIESPWIRIYGDLDGVLVQLLVNGEFPATTVPVLKVQFRTSRDDFSGDPSNYADLNDQTTDMGVADQPYKVFGFGTQDGDGLYPGESFRRVQFRFKWYEAAATDRVKWPELLGYALTFIKHTTRKRYTCTVDVPLTISENAVAKEFQNFQEVLLHIQNCINSPLSKVVIPGLTTSMVSIKAVQAVHEEFDRDTTMTETDEAVNVVSPGRIQLILEEVAPREADDYQKLTPVPA